MAHTIKIPKIVRLFPRLVGVWLASRQEQGLPFRLLTHRLSKFMAETDVRECIYSDWMEFARRWERTYLGFLTP